MLMQYDFGLMSMLHVIKYKILFWINDPNGIILVSQLFNSTLSGWDVHKLNWWFESSTVDLILKIPIFPTSYKDQWHGLTQA